MKTTNYIVLNENELIVDGNCDFELVHSTNGVNFYTADRFHRIKDGKVIMSKQFDKYRYFPLYMEIDGAMVRVINNWGLKLEDVIKRRCENMIRHLSGIQSSVSGLNARVKNGDLKVLVK